MKRFSDRKSQHGSALLIVLGFLTFMTISAVSFAIYMRVERQATSNYRHSLVARHVLGTALNEAISETDRYALHSYNSDLPANNLAFPPCSNEYDDVCGWLDYGRIYNSDGSGPAHILSMDALCCVPQLFLNDLRYYTVSNAVQGRTGTFQNPGATWVPLKIPAAWVNDSNDTTLPMHLDCGETVVGRYAFTCLNVSDFININRCTLGNARDTQSRRISVYQLLNRQTANVQTNYTSVQDFNATLFDKPNATLSKSPAYDWLSGNVSAIQVANEVYSNCKKHLFVTDGYASGNTNTAACNVRRHSPSGSGCTSWDSTFTTAFKQLFSTSDRGNFYSTSGTMASPIAAMLGDYLAPAAVAPSRYDVPSAKQAPMICSITPRFNPEIYAVKAPTKDDPNHMDYYLAPAGTANRATMDIGVLYPFRTDPKVNGFTLNVELYFYLFDSKKNNRGLSGVNPSHSAIQNLTANSLNQRNYTSIGGTFSASGQTSEQGCFSLQSVIFNDKPAAIKISEGTDYADSSSFRVVIVPFVTLARGGTLYDVAPCLGIYPKLSLNEDHLRAPKLYFQTTSFARAAGAQNWEYSSLYCPDPRFNYAACNWTADSAAISAATFLTHAKSYCNQKGSDQDIFLQVSGAGVMQSPGEWGFLVRPHNNYPPTRAANNTTPFSTATAPAESDHFYQTVRLFNHGSAYPADPVWDCFTADDANVEELPGARINPYSNIPDILQAAIDCTPLDYATAYDNELLSASTVTTAAKTFDDVNGWSSFKTWWLENMDKARPALGSGIENVYAGRVHKRTGGSVDSGTYTDVDYRLAGGNEWDWYSDGAISSLHSADRKMLYSFSLDSFSARQQLFIYLVQAEAASSATAVGAKSLAGGRAVAAVRRDPYIPYGAAYNNIPVHKTRVLSYRQLNN